MQRALGPSIEIETMLAADPWQVRIDAGQLENAILNLCINARDAMPDGGRLTIETANTELDETYAAAQSNVAAGEYVLMTITDTGTGIPADVIGKVFDPFFTTKPVGQGSGLGLSMVYGFVRQSAGHVTVYSESGRGTTFKFYLPRDREPGAVTAPVTAAGRPADGIGEQILLVEDDDGVRAYAVAALDSLGYRVIEASDAAGALAVLEGPEVVDLLFTDIGLPGRSGGKLVKDARRVRPGLPVLFTTGYSANMIVRDGVLDASLPLLAKPFTIAALAAKVREALEAAGAGSEVLE
jgi:CheY-like chemotaxis protein